MMLFIISIGLVGYKESYNKCTSMGGELYIRGQYLDGTRGICMSPNGDVLFLSNIPENHPDFHNKTGEIIIPEKTMIDYIL